MSHDDSAKICPFSIWISLRLFRPFAPESIIDVLDQYVRRSGALGAAAGNDPPLNGVKT
jgi:hypothetical protein